MKTPYKIDIHHHIVPPQAAEYLASLGITQIGGITIPAFEVQKTLAFMDKNNIKTAIVSLSDVGGAFAKEKDAVAISRMSNSYFSDLREQHKGRFGAFATLPLPYLASAKEELTYALDTLKLDGVMLLSNIEGIYLGDERFDNIMKELDRRRAVVFVHPGATPQNSSKDALSFPDFMLEFVFDTTRAMTNMIVNRIPEKYPHITFIFAHMGGTMPYLIERISLGIINVRHYNPKLSPKTQEKMQKVAMALGKVIPPDFTVEHASHVQKALKSFYYDTAVSSAFPTFAAVKELAGIEHILFGTDYSYAPETVNQFSTTLLDKWGLDQVEKQCVEAQNAVKLFPQLS